ncbi:2767_t:CDS:2 [Ambispora leptoticha]|uniref:2767_t:CDS:1 n=1 Tax=Ambispora leptoticha TaxID=144679 RepID=A0A9N8WEZ8_9GLOM|nr:2767_t:CDS:2 [Ambispora leptoticha]
MNIRICTSKLLLVFLVIYGELLLSQINVYALYLEARRSPLEKRGTQVCSNSGDAAYLQGKSEENLPPAAFVYAANVADVQVAVKCAAASNINVAPRSGGHSYEVYSLGGKDGSLVIDLTNLNQIAIDTTAKTAIIGAGNRLGPIHYALSQAGYLIPIGSCPDVGIGGFTLGGGYGLYSRKFGLAVDNVLSIDMVDANGNLITASPNQNSDLFFALRGAGGGNYGVVTSFIFNITPIQTQVTSFQYHWTTNATQTLIPVIEKYATNGPDEVTFRLIWSKAGLEIQGAYFGLQSGLSNVLRSILAVPGYRTIRVAQESFYDSVVFFSNRSDSFVRKPTHQSFYFKAKSMYIGSSGLSAAGIDAFNNYLASPACRTYAIINIYGGVINRVPSNAMAFVHRDPLLLIQLTNGWMNSSLTTNCLNNINSFSASFQSQYTSPYSYQNYIDRDLSNWQNAYYGANYQKLVNIKAKYDPNNLFAFPQSIPTS